jgi:hypothetical protein
MITNLRKIDSGDLMRDLGGHLIKDVGWVLKAGDAGTGCKAGERKV